MRTTLDIKDSLLAQAKALAAKEGISLTRLVEEGLALRLRPLASRFDGEHPSLSVFNGESGLTPVVADSLSNRALEDASDDLADK